MLKVLLKKQIAEVFRSYFYDAKKNRMRSKGAIAAWIVFFVVIMVGVLGGMFTVLSLSLCGALLQAGMGWLYFLLMGMIAIVLGAFGSVFSTYSGLYLAKDNDLLLSMPIPVKTVIASRLINVYLMGAMYAATVLLPTIIVYWIVGGLSAAKVVCGLLFMLLVTVIVLLLSCILGWVVAKISLKLKNKSFITVLISLVFIGAYYFFYFKATDFVRDIVQNAETYGNRIKGAAYGLYLFGRMGEGSWAAAGICTAVTAVVSLLVWRVLSRSFLKIATSSGAADKRRYVEKKTKERSVFGAMLAKEFGRFTASANYMLNCGLGILLLPASGVLLLIKGREVCEAVESVFSGRPGCAAVLLCTMICLMACMNDMAAPSVSLEGKSIWIPQSLPVESKTVLWAKTAMQLILTGIPVLFAAVCAAIVLPESTGLKIMLVITALVTAAFMAMFDISIGLAMPILNWTNETAPIKQSGAVTLALLGGWGIIVIPGILYLLIGWRLGAVTYLIIWAAVMAVISLVLLRRLDTKGAAAFRML